MTAAVKGLEKARWICENYDARARELQQQGKKVIGYFCHFAPLELVEAAGLVPYGIRGNMGEEVTHSDEYVEPYLCPMVRRCFDQRLKGKDDFLDGLLISHSCDSVQRIYGLWTYYLKPAYSYLFNVPHVPSSWSREFFEREIVFFQESLERYTGGKISRESISNNIERYNRNRELIKELYAWRNSSQIMTGTELYGVLIAGRALPAHEFTVLLEEVMDELLMREGSRGERGPRVMVYGSIIDDVKLIELIEGCGCELVVDDTCLGTRSNFHPVRQDLGYLEAFTRHYFTDFKCPRTFRGTGTERFQYIADLAGQFEVDGVVMYTLSFCDPHQLDIPDLRDYLEDRGIPSLILEDDYSLSHEDSVKNRVEAFLELLG